MHGYKNPSPFPSELNFIIHSLARKFPMSKRLIYFLSLFGAIMFIAGYHVPSLVVHGEVEDLIAAAPPFALLAELLFMIFIRLTVSLRRSPITKPLGMAALCRAAVLVGQMLRYITADETSGSADDDSVFYDQFFLFLYFGSVLAVMVVSSWRWALQRAAPTTFTVETERRRIIDDPETAGIAPARRQRFKIVRRLALTALVIMASSMILLLAGNPDQLNDLSSKIYLVVNFTLLVLASVAVVLSLMHREN